MEQQQIVDGLGGLAFQALQQERQLGDLDGLRVQVYAVDIVGEDALALADREDEGWPLSPALSPRTLCANAVTPCARRTSRP